VPARHDRLLATVDAAGARGCLGEGDDPPRRPIPFLTKKWMSASR
jgi:hypothetical protein